MPPAMTPGFGMTQPLRDDGVWLRKLHLMRTPPCPSFRGHRATFKAGSIARGISNYHSRRRAIDGDELYSGDKLAQGFPSMP